MEITVNVSDLKLSEAFERTLTEGELEQVKNFLQTQVDSFIEDVLFELPEIQEEIFF